MLHSYVPYTTLLLWIAKVYISSKMMINFQQEVLMKQCLNRYALFCFLLQMLDLKAYRFTLLDSTQIYYVIEKLTDVTIAKHM